MATPDALNIESLVSRPPERGWDSAGTLAINRLAATRWGGVRSLSDFPSWSLSAGSGDGEWVARASDATRDLAVTVRWIASESSAVTTQSELKMLGMPANSPPEQTHYLWRWSEWKPVLVGGETVLTAHRLETIWVQTGEPATVVNLEAVGAVAQSTLDAVLRVPDPIGVDPVRGQLRMTAVNDYRPEVAKATISTADGETEVPLRVTRDEKYGWLRPTGWACFAGCVAVVVWLRMRAKTT